MAESALPADDVPLGVAQPQAAGETKPLQIRDLLDEHFDFIWRSLRRLGVATASLDDATQQVFWTASKKLPTIRPGCERSFLLGVAVRVAADARRISGRMERREIAQGLDIETHVHPGPSADELLDRKRGRAILDQFLDSLSLELRVTFVLFEGEGLTVSEIADLVGAPAGTIASRLRLARERFRRMVENLSLESGRREEP